MRRFFVSFVTVQLRSFDVFPFLSDRKFRHFDRKQERDLAGCEGSIGLRPLISPVDLADNPPHTHSGQHLRLFTNCHGIRTRYLAYGQPVLHHQDNPRWVYYFEENRILCFISIMKYGWEG
ncbi:hypothetical protein KFK09_019998 [Dendrobium nobile]|uniref:Uncharacterized protein n=1 Tax=Dendrobium nobile TaxID=94219 RepID=A0A8T3ASK8_DENNO|nr:hypothetical protein KFK09_019998 [Dendrobium nobile]